MTGTTLSPRNANFLEVLKSYYQLTKPRIIPLLLITTAAAMWLAAKGAVDFVQVLITLLGGSLAAASAQTFNCIYDQDIDYQMLRTRARPIPSGRVQPRHAFLFAVVLGVSSFCLFAFWINLLSAWLAMSGIVFYLGIYTHLLKRHSTQNIVIGGAAGAIPPLVGWAAVTGELSLAAWCLFLMIFLWTPPHFWSLALMIREDYAQVEIPMLPVIKGVQLTVKQIWLYSWLAVISSLLLVYPLQVVGIVYLLTALVLGVIFLYKAWLLKGEPHNQDLARSLFKYSILYMMLLCTAVVVDSYFA